MLIMGYMVCSLQSCGDWIAPQLIVDINDGKLGLIGRLVIDSVVNNRSLGGIRIMPDTTLDELVGLARNMTLKFGFWGIPMGGAKSCIFADDSISEGKRNQLLACFGESLSPLLKLGIYIPGSDMGSNASDVVSVLTSSGLHVRSEKDEGSQTRDARNTSWTMLASAKTAAEHIGMDLADSDIAIEGFGKVGSEAAVTFANAGARLVAISTKKGAVYDRSGLDVNKLVKLKEKFGDDVVNKYPAKKVSKSDIHKLDVDVLMPCNGAWSINASNFEGIKSRIVCPGANIPFTPEIEELMHKRDVFCIPDIIANSGGVFGGHLSSIASEQKIHALINSETSRKFLEIIRIAETSNITPGKVAREMSMKRFFETKQKAEQSSILKSKILRSFAKVMPRRVKNLIAHFYLKRVLF